MVAKPIKDLGERVTVEAKSLLNRIRANKKDADTKFVAVNGRVDTVDARVTTVNNRVTTVDNRVTTLNTLVSGIDTKLTGVDNRVKDVESAWINWTPTFPVYGSMTFIPTTITYARYKVIGKTCHFALRVVGEVTGAVSIGIRFTLPEQAFLNGSVMLGSAVTNDAGINIGWVQSENRTTALVRKLANANGTNSTWSLGADRYFYVSGTYELL